MKDSLYIHFYMVSFSKVFENIRKWTIAIDQTGQKSLLKRGAKFRHFIALSLCGRFRLIKTDST